MERGLYLLARYFIAMFWVQALINNETVIVYTPLNL